MIYLTDLSYLPGQLQASVPVYLLTVRAFPASNGNEMSQL